MAAAERIERRYLGSLLRLTLLAPEILQAVLDCHIPADLALPRLLEPFPATWADQAKALIPQAGTAVRRD